MKTLQLIDVGEDSLPPRVPVFSGSAPNGLKAFNQFGDQTFEFADLPTKESIRLDLVGFIKSLAPEIREALSTKVDILFDFGDCHSAFVDPVTLRDIMAGLVSAANRAMPNGGRLIIEIRDVEWFPPSGEAIFEQLSAGRYARLALINSGRNDEQAPARAFEPLRERTSIDQTPRFNLAHAQAIVNQFGGCIRVESTEKADTAIEIFLRCAGTIH